LITPTVNGKIIPNSLMRVLSTKTSIEHDKVCFGSTLLTGVLYQQLDGSNWLQGEKYVIDGEILPDEKRYAARQRIILHDRTEPITGPLQVEGQPFNGIGYRFDTEGKLVSWISYVDGISQPKTFRRWHPSGVLAENGELLPGLAFCFYESGPTSRIQGMGITAEYLESGGLKSLEVKDEHESSYLYKIYLEPETELRLKGRPLVDKHVVALGDFSGVMTLTLEETNLTAYGLSAFNACELESLTTLRNHSLTSAEIGEFVARQKNCIWHEEEA
jgi:hypothetical protein